MTWPLTPEEEFNPLLLPPVSMEYAPTFFEEGQTSYVVGIPEMNPWYSGGQGYAGPTEPHQPEQLPSFDRPLLYGRGKMPSEYQADYPQSFWPQVVDSYEAMFNRPPAATRNERDWPGSDVRVDFTWAPRQPIPNWNPSPRGGGVEGGLALGEWYDTTPGTIAIGVAAGAASYFAVRTFLKMRKRNFARR